MSVCVVVSPTRHCNYSLSWKANRDFSFRQKTVFARSIFPFGELARAHWSSSGFTISVWC